jgi:hypothetical protein
MTIKPRSPRNSHYFGLSSCSKFVVVTPVYLGTWVVYDQRECHVQETRGGTVPQIFVVGLSSVVNNRFVVYCLHTNSSMEFALHCLLMSTVSARVR